MTNHTTRMVLAAGLAATLALPIAAAGDDLRTHGSGDDNVQGGSRPLIPDPGFDYGDLPMTDSSVETTLLLHATREAIAMEAEWLGPGPDNLNLLLAGDNDDWLEELRARVRTLGLRANGYGIEQQLAQANGAGGADIAAWFAPASNTVVGTDYGGRGHTVLNLWPVVPTSHGPKGEIPYTFSAAMIQGYLNRNVTTDPVVANAANGVANALAVMLILEQELPVRFVGFNPVAHDLSGTLLFDSIGDGTPLGGTNNSISRIGRGPAGGDPTTMTHNSWQNFPSMIRSLGFVLGLDWEQRHPDRDTFIEVHPETFPPAGFPSPPAPPNGVNGPGIPDTPLPGAPGIAGEDTGPLFWEQTLRPTNVPSAPGCGFDLNSMMLMGPFDYTTIGPTYTIRDEYRYVDLNGDGVVNTTPAGPDDRMFNQPLPVFFSDCDIAALTVTYTSMPPWSYGGDETCFYDINGDNVQDGRDAALFMQLFNDQDPSADLVPPFGQVDEDDLDAFNGDRAFPGIVPFQVQSCVGPNDPDIPTGAPWFYSDDDICNYDINDDEIQDGRDALLFVILFNAGHPAADLVPPFGVVDGDDMDAFQFGATFGPGPTVIEPFTISRCKTSSYPAGTPWFYGLDPQCPHDLNGDEVLDGTDADLYEALYNAGDPRADLVVPFGVVNPDDRFAFFFGAPPFIQPFVIGACQLDPSASGWFYGRDPLCPWDINGDQVQDGQDIQLFINFFESNNPAADLVAPFGNVNQDDLNAFQNGGPGIQPFFPQVCTDEDLPPGFPWFYGKNPNCPHDVNGDLIQDARDIVLFQGLWEAGDFAADIVPPFGQIDIADFQAFVLGGAGVTAFTPGFCTENGPPGPGNRPGRANPG